DFGSVRRREPTLISAASMEGEIHANKKVPANRRRINEALQLASVWVALVQTVILCLNHDVMLCTAPSLGALVKTRVLAHERAIAEPSCKYDACCPENGDHNCSC